MSARLPVVAALALCCTCLPAQQSFEARAALWQAADLPAHLAAADLVEVAWAGYLVQRDRVRAAIPAVRAALQRLADQHTLHGRLARAQLLDALIQLDVPVPAEELLPHAEGSLRGAVLVLASKAPEANEQFFVQRFAERGDDLEWQYCGEWLTRWHHRDLVPQCLERFELSLRIVVTDGRSPGVG